MEKEKLYKIIKETVENSKNFSMQGEKIFYTYSDKDFKISYYYNYNYKLGAHITFSTEDFPSFYNKRKRINSSYISVTSATIEKNNKIILSKLRTLTKRINEYHNLSIFLEKEKKNMIRKIKNYVIKYLCIDKETKMVISFNPIIHYYKTYNSNKRNLILNDCRCNVNVEFSDIIYTFHFDCVIPSKWSYGWYPNSLYPKTKQIKLTSYSEEFKSTKKIYNIIRYAKLKKLTENV